MTGVGFNHKTFSFVPTVVAGVPYAAWDQFGTEGSFELQVGPTNKKTHVGLSNGGFVDKGKNAAINFTVLLFNQQPVITSTDNDPLGISGAEFHAKFAGWFGLSTAAFQTANVGLYYLGTTPRVMETSNTGKLWAVVLAGAAFTIANVGDLKFWLSFQEYGNIA